MLYSYTNDRVCKSVHHLADMLNIWLNRRPFSVIHDNLSEENEYVYKWSIVTETGLKTLNINVIRKNVFPRSMLNFIVQYMSVDGSSGRE